MMREPPEGTGRKGTGEVGGAIGENLLRLRLADQRAVNILERC
jgi:hypothetical protein